MKKQHQLPNVGEFALDRIMDRLAVVDPSSGIENDEPPLVEVLRKFRDEFVLPCFFLFQLFFDKYYNVF